jgi:multidrug efflux pump subunit AcrA (membrane-fusion protein)
LNSTFLPVILSRRPRPAQGRGFFFLVDPNTSKLAQGAAVSGLLTLPGEAQSGVAVPREAVIRYNGATWVYRQTSNETFERLRTTLDRPLENGWFVREGLKPGDKLVTAGAQQMLSEELKGSGE